MRYRLFIYKAWGLYVRLSVRACTDRPQTWSADTVDCVKCADGDGSNNVKGDRKRVDGKFGDDRSRRGRSRQTDRQTDRRSTPT